jgi:hydroxyacylglutathione hydrolase
MIINTFPSGPSETNAYVAACPHTLAAAIIDPAPNSADAIASFITRQNLKPVALLITHSHWDHIGDAAAIATRYQIPAFIHELDRENLESPGSDGLPCWISITPLTPAHLIEEGDVIPVGNLKFTVIHTPGHTPGGVCFYSPEEHTLFSGDTLFQGTIGNLSFATARPNLMWPSLEKLSLLPPDTKVFPGHGAPTTIGHEKWLARAEEIFGNDF